MLLLLIMCGVAASPLVLREALDVPGFDWARLGDIGQAYGAVSALLSAVALVTVTLSIFVQLRQNQLARHGAMRVIHLELTKLSLANWPLYNELFGIEIPGVRDTRPHMFANTMMGYFYVEFDTGYLSRDGLRELLRDLFDSTVGREYWQSVRSGWLNAPATGRTYYTFLSTVEEGFNKAVSGGPPSRGESLPETRGDLLGRKTALEKRMNPTLGMAAVGAFTCALGVGIGLRIAARHKSR